MPMPRLAEEERHGRRGTYVNGCRCGSCRAANAAYSRTQSARREQQAAVRLVADLLEQLRASGFHDITVS